MKMVNPINVAPILAPVKGDGLVWNVEEIRKAEIRDGPVAHLIGDPAYDKQANAHGAGLMTLERTLQDAIGETDEAFKLYEKARHNFRSEIKNDVASIESSAGKLEATFRRLADSINAISRAYTSAEFVDAVANAQRLARALQEIESLQNSKITFAVIENKPQA